MTKKPAIDFSDIVEDWGKSKVTFPRDTELENHTREELLEELLYTFGVDWMADERYNRRSVIESIISHRQELAYDLEELNAMTKRQLAEWADHWGYPFRRSGTKAEIIDDLLPYY